MKKLIVLFVLSFFFSVAYCQHDILILKKKNQLIKSFWEGSIIAFQLQDKEWQHGKITKLLKDSFYIKPMVIQYNFMSIDTIYFSVIGYSLADIYAFPKNGFNMKYVNGHFQITASGSRVKWYWIKTGWIFRAGALGYAGLNIINGIIKKDFSFSQNKTQLGIAGGVLLGGILLGKIYKPTLRLGRKYHTEILKISNY